MTATPAPFQSSIQTRLLPSPELWAAVEPLLPEPPGGGRPCESDHQMFAAIFYVLTTGIQ